MDSFFDINFDKFYQKYATNLDRRYWTFKIALGLFRQYGGKKILETGCTHLENDWGAGNSTPIFAEYAQQNQVDFVTVDIEKKNIIFARKLCQEWPERTQFVTADSLKTLEEWKEPIDLLYLDSYDTHHTDRAIADASQDHQLKELMLAERCLTDHAVVLLDDNFFANGGKTRKAKEYLMNHGYLLIMDFEQSLWLRRV